MAVTDLVLENTSRLGETAGRHHCPACEQGDLRDFYRVDRVPTNSCILLPTREEALAYPVGDIVLAFCETCGFVFNRLFDEKKTEYSGRYEETQSFSGTFNAFHRALAARLVERHGLKGGSALEIGCGKGEFLALLAEIGAVNGVGIDPGVKPERLSAELAGLLDFRAEFFRPDHIDRHFDLIACKMTIEHIPEPLRLVDAIREGVGERRDCVVFFQAPEAMRIFAGCAFEDVYYEHCAYFSAGSLARLFRRSRFEILDIDVEYGDQYLTIEAIPADGETDAKLPMEHDLGALAAAVDRFSEGCAAMVGEWKSRLAVAGERGETVAVWGSGSKAVAFLTAVDQARRIALVTDINPNRHGFFMPGTGQEIVSPQRLAEAKPDLVIAMNRIYVDEIRRDLQAMGCDPEIAAL